MIRTIILTIVFIATLAAQNAAPDEPGSISGVVVNAATGQPLPDLDVVLLVRGSPPPVTTDAQGRYTFEGLAPRGYTVAVGFSRDHPFSGGRSVTVGPGEHVRSIDFRLYPDQSISGRVVDENDEPLSGVEVVLLGRELYMGELRYYRNRSDRTNDEGEYRLVRKVSPGTGWLVWATMLNRKMEPISDAPVDPKLRRPAMVPTYYPIAPTAEEATVLTLGTGEQMEGVDIRMARLPSFCLEAQIDVPGQPDEVSFQIEGVQPSFRMGATGGTTGLPPGGRVGPDRKIRVCDLGPGDYRLTAFSGDLNVPDSLGMTLVSIADRDVKDITVVAQPRLALPGRVVWAGEPPEKLIESEISISLYPLLRVFGGLGTRGQSRVPGEFTMYGRASLAGGEADPLMDEYAVKFQRLPDNIYVKDVTYGGTSVLHRPLKLGSAMAGSELRVVVDHDGGVLKARVTDGEGQPIGDATVILIPKEATTNLRLAETRVAEKTDQNGEYTSPGLAPGAYYVLVTEDDFTDLSPETISTLFDARSKAEEVEIGPNATVELKLDPLKLTR
ncbi:MAG TPA: carboxypeptidase-like regulatory domain-containing protein [Bryobacterales bacterium]|nr:carboxypeptidase-like regulatory domain-containing protein [Bryobacterales bacterium]